MPETDRHGSKVDKALSRCPVVAFIATTNMARAREFYERTLGLRVLREDAFALVLDCAGTTVRIVRVDGLTPAPFTVLGWQVANIVEVMGSLQEKGVSLVRYDGHAAGPTRDLDGPGRRARGLVQGSRWERAVDEL